MSDKVEEATGALVLAWWRRRIRETYYAKAMPGCRTCRDHETCMEKNLKCDGAFEGILENKNWRPRRVR
jgi:hypothetical protein